MPCCWQKGHAVTLWARREEICQALRKRENIAYCLMLLPASIEITNSLEEATKTKEIVVLASPSKAVRYCLGI